MQKSEFLKLLDEAALQVVHEYNAPETDETTFDWGVTSAKASNQRLKGVEEEVGNKPLALAVRRIACVKRVGGHLNMEDFIAIEAAWEFFGKEGG